MLLCLLPDHSSISYMLLHIFLKSAIFRVRNGRGDGEAVAA